MNNNEQVIFKYYEKKKASTVASKQEGPEFESWAGCDLSVCCLMFSLRCVSPHQLKTGTTGENLQTKMNWRCTPDALCSRQVAPVALKDGSNAEEETHKLSASIKLFLTIDS